MSVRADIRAGAGSRAAAVLLAGFALTTAAPAVAQDDLPNACPVDGCEVRIASAAAHDGEVALTLEANFMPDLSKNHVHVWWGEQFSVEQVSNNAETVHGVEQGSWHPTDAYPDYVTQSAASTAVREGATTLCVSAADRNHDILDPARFHCVDVGDAL